MLDGKTIVMQVRLGDFSLNLVSFHREFVQGCKFIDVMSMLTNLQCYFC